MMPETDNVAIVRRCFELLAEQGPHAVAPLLADDVVVHDPDLPGGGTFHGREGFIELANQAMEPFDDYDIEVERLIDAGSRVVALLHHTARGRESGAPIDLRDAHVWTLGGGRVTRIDLYLDRRQALNEAGVRE